MSRCETIRKKNRRVCIGDMNDVITLQNRDIDSPLFDVPDFTLDFTDQDPVNIQSFSLIETTTGKTYFDGANTDTPITHFIYIPFNSLVTAETWIEFEDRRIDILRVEDMEERHEFMKLTCVDRGLISKQASQA